MTEISIEQNSPEIFNFEPADEKPAHEAIKIKLVQNIADVNTDLWIGFKSKGHRFPAEIFATHDRTKALLTCSADGVAIDDKEFLFVDADQVTNRAFFLLDAPIGNHESQWIENLITRCLDFKVSNLGIFFDSALILPNFSAFMIDSLTAMFSRLVLREFFVLTTSHDYNILLNAVLTTQKRLVDQHLEFDVYH